jgi:hypothetical protein
VYRNKESLQTLAQKKEVNWGILKENRRKILELIVKEQNKRARIGFI